MACHGGGWRPGTPGGPDGATVRPAIVDARGSVCVDLPERWTGTNAEGEPMTEDGGRGPEGATVDSVTGLLASRLGAVGESAGEVVRRDVRTAAGGAESIALLVQADADGAGQFPDALGHLTGGADIGPVPDASLNPQRIPPDRLPAGDDPPLPPRPAGPDTLSGTSQAGPPDVRQAPEGDGGRQDRDTRTLEPGPAVGPGSEPAGRTPAGTADTQPVPEQEAPVEAAAADPVPHRDVPPPALGEAPPSGTPSQTPWTSGHSGSSPEPSRNEVTGTTPWNSGTHPAMPHMPGMPGGLPSLPTPQERPSRGNPPWSRGRGGGTVFPRAQPEGHPSGGADRPDGAAWYGPGHR